MTVIERAIAETVAVEVRDTVTGVWRDLNVMLTGCSGTRGADTSGATDTLKVGTLTLSLFGDVDLGVDTALRPNALIRIRHKVSNDVAFTVSIVDAVQSFEWSDDRRERFTFTNVMCADAVQALGNIARYGVVAPGGRQTWAERITQLNASAVGVDVTPPLNNNNPVYTFPSVRPIPFNTTSVDGWTPQVAGTTYFSGGGDYGMQFQITNPSWNPISGTSLNVAQSSIGIQRTFTGLTVGKQYEMTFIVGFAAMPDSGEPDNARYWRVQIDNRAWSAESALVLDSSAGFKPDGTPYMTARDRYIAPLIFTATSTTHVIRLANARAFSLLPGTSSFINYGMKPGTLSEVAIADDYQLQDVVYESSLLNHYQLACDSVGARFWVDSDNTVQFRRASEDTQPVMIFTDDIDPTIVSNGWYEVQRNVIPNPTMTTPARWSVNGAATVVSNRLRATADLSTQLRVEPILSDNVRVVAKYGERIAARVRVQGHPTKTFKVSMKLRATTSSGTTQIFNQAGVTIPPATSVVVDINYLVTTAFDYATVVAEVQDSTGNINIAIGDYLEFSEFAFMGGPGAPSALPTPYYTGATANTSTIHYEWAGVPNASPTMKQLDNRGPKPQQSYTGIDIAFDTRSVVNSATMNNHGRKIEDGEERADDRTVTIRDEDSISQWNVREGRLDTCIWTGFEHELDLEQRARELFQLRATPGYMVTHIRFNAQSDLSLAFSLDIYSRIRINFEGFTQLSRVAQIKHSFTGRRWMIDLYLTESTFGPSFDEFSDYYAGMTFDQLSDLFAGQTFDQITKRSLQEH